MCAHTHLQKSSIPFYILCKNPYKIEHGCNPSWHLPKEYMQGMVLPATMPIALEYTNEQVSVVQCNHTVNLVLLAGKISN